MSVDFLAMPRSYFGFGPIHAASYSLLFPACPNYVGRYMLGQPVHAPPVQILAQPTQSSRCEQTVVQASSSNSRSTTPSLSHSPRPFIRAPDRHCQSLPKGVGDGMYMRAWLKCIGGRWTQAPGAIRSAWRDTSTVWQLLWCNEVSSGGGQQVVEKYGSVLRQSRDSAWERMNYDRTVIGLQNKFVGNNRS